MWKLVYGIILFLIACALGGIACGKLSNEFDAISDMSDDLKLMYNTMKYERICIIELTSKLQSVGKLSKFWMEMEKELKRNEGVMSAWQNASKLLTSLNKKDMDMLNAFFADFGKGGTQAELNRFEFMLENINESVHKKKNEYEKRIKLIRTLSSLAGLALAIMVL